MFKLKKKLIKFCFEELFLPFLYDNKIFSCIKWVLGQEISEKKHGCSIIFLYTMTFILPCKQISRSTPVSDLHCPCLCEPLNLTDFFHTFKKKNFSLLHHLIYCLPSKPTKLILFSLLEVFELPSSTKETFYVAIPVLGDLKEPMF